MIEGKSNVSKKMIRSYPELNERVRAIMNNYAVECPNVMEGYSKLHEECFKDSALSHKTKELIALGIAICIRCDKCIVYHINDAIKAGATHDEIVCTIGVAILMGGSPSVVYGSQALDALREFEDSEKLGFDMNL